MPSSRTVWEHVVEQAARRGVVSGLTIDVESLAADVTRVATQDPEFRRLVRAAAQAFIEAMHRTPFSEAPPARRRRESRRRP